jgi:FtsH-binding integral membrane protein
MGFAQASHRPIPGAVATVGVSDRVAFLRKTYAHLGFALLAWAALTMGIMKYMTATSLKFGLWAMGVPNGGRWNWLMVMVLFMAVGWGADRMARSDTSRGLQYGGLALAVVAQAIILQPLLWIVIFKFGAADVVAQGLGGQLALSPKAATIMGQAALITGVIFGGLTAVVFVTKKDFSFLRGALVVASLGMVAMLLASIIFGFSMGALFSAFGILLMAGYILYETSAVMRDFPPSHYVAAALVLFSTVATLFWHVLSLLTRLTGRD